MGKLDGKVAIITGGSAGIGLATAQRFAEEGAFVYLTGRRQAELESAVAKVGHGAVGVQGDVAVAEDMERVYDIVRHNGHRIDVIGANAGSGGFMRLEDVTDEHVETLFGVNVKGALNTVQKALPLLNDGASIVLVTSMAATTGREGLGVYSAAKAAVCSFARTWAYELRGRNIRVNALAPAPRTPPRSTSRSARSLTTRQRGGSGRRTTRPMCRSAGCPGPRSRPRRRSSSLRRRAATSRVPSWSSMGDSRRCDGGAHCQEARSSAAAAAMLLAVRTNALRAASGAPTGQPSTSTVGGRSTTGTASTA
jgi:NAD(P)-dependent dehydrogenase (short-subunit alcohol dehydrogenase family)